jgi:hypothetical protein
MPPNRPIADPFQIAISRKRQPRTDEMFWAIVAIVLTMWASGFFALHIGGPLIHVLAVVAVVMTIDRLVLRRLVTGSGRRGESNQEGPEALVDEDRTITE